MLLKIVLKKEDKEYPINKIPLKTPNKLEIKTLLNYLKYSIRFLKKTILYFFYKEQWILGYSFDATTIGIDLKKDNKIVPPKDRFWADPVIIEDNGRYYVFIEELIYKNKIAHLSVFELKEDGSYSEPKIILKKPYHLSYPFVFKEQGKYYMIPETAHNNDIQLYEAHSFPFHWKFKQNLMENIKASDTTLLKKDGKWWMFTSIKHFNQGIYDNDLSVFYADSLFSTVWSAHMKTPMKQDIANARQGGPFFKIDNEYFRVSQNCETNYGNGFNVNKVQNISESKYMEDLVYGFSAIGMKNTLGVHTYNHLKGRLRFYDILTRTFKY